MVKEAILVTVFVSLLFGPLIAAVLFGEFAHFAASLIWAVAVIVWIKLVVEMCEDKEGEV